jgi:uncharacterized membrane protein
VQNGAGGILEAGTASVVAIVAVVVFAAFLIGALFGVIVMVTAAVRAEGGETMRRKKPGSHAQRRRLG